MYGAGGGSGYGGAGGYGGYGGPGMGGGVAGYGYQPITYDGRRPRAQVQRKALDYNNCIMRHLHLRSFYKRDRDMPALQGDDNYWLDVTVPTPEQAPASAVATHYMHTSINKARYPVNVISFTPDGRRLMTGLSSGEFTLWNALTFHFEMIMTAHDDPIRTIAWSPYDDWVISGDNSGRIMYWLPNLNNVKRFSGHTDPIRGLSFAPTAAKFASCADDNLLKVWDFATGVEERTLKGHGSEVRCVDWHPVKGLIASGSRDNLVKLWDPRSSRTLSTLHYHKNAVLGCSWNRNGNWLATCSRDSQIIIMDVRQMQPLQVFAGHKKEVCSLAWHPQHESLLASGGSDGSIMQWVVGVPQAVATIETAHEQQVWSLAWHPVGHMLASGSNDHTTKYWGRNPPGDTMQDRYSLGSKYTGPAEPAPTSDEPSSETQSGAFIPGMGSAASIPRTAPALSAPTGRAPFARSHSREGTAAAAPYPQRGARRF